MFSIRSWFSNLGTVDVVLVLVLLLGVVVVLARHRHQGRARLAATAAFGVYLAFVAAVLFCPLPVDPPVNLFIGDPNRSAVAVSLELSFAPWRGAPTSNQDLMNILLTVPFGFGLPWIVRWRPGTLVAACVGLAVAFEALQTGLSWLAGWPYRAGDVNDLLANLLGALIGLAGFAILARRGAAGLGSGPRAGASCSVLWEHASSRSVSPPVWVGGARSSDQARLVPTVANAPEGTSLATGRSATAALYAAVLEVVPGTGSDFRGQDLDPGFPKVHGQLRFSSSAADGSGAGLVSVDIALDQLMVSEYQTAEETLACDSSLSHCRARTLLDGSVLRTSRESGSGADGELKVAERLVDRWYVAVTADGGSHSGLSVDQLSQVVSQPWWSLYLPERFSGAEDVSAYTDPSF